MKRLFFVLVALMALSCTSNQTMITPTTVVAQQGEDTKGLRYYPGISIGVKTENFDQRVAEIASAGFKYIEISIAHKSGLWNMTDEEVRQMLTKKQQAAAANNLTVWSIHLPFEDKVWTNIGGEESIRVQSVANIMRVLRLCTESIPECKNYVLHASKGTLKPRSESVLQARKSLSEMLPVAKEYGVRLCVENLVGSFCYTKEDLNAVITPYSDGFATFDIGHANCKGYDVVEYLIHLGRRLGTVHIHDTIYKSGNDSHMLVGTGDIATKNHRWGEIYKTLLVNNGYRGVFMFEPKDDQKAVDVMATYEEIVRDYLSLP